MAWTNLGLAQNSTLEYTEVNCMLSLDASGNLGIGTASPTNNLHIVDGGTDTDTTLEIDTYNDQTGVYPALIFKKSHTDTVGTNTTTIDTEELGRIIFYGVDAGGNTDFGAFIQAKQNGAASTRVPTDLAFWTSTDTAISERMRIDSTGNVGIGETAPDSKLEVNGAIHSTDLDGGAINVTANAAGQLIRDPSDERLKKDITPIQSALDTIAELKPVSFKFKDTVAPAELPRLKKESIENEDKTISESLVEVEEDFEPNMGTDTNYGFIAQDLEKVLPELVSTGTDGIKGIKKDNIIAFCVKAIQEQQAIIEDLQARVIALEGR